ncbi:MAG: hypothetical protein QOD60_1519 [Solirubrobacterales bacterium]|jgi:hypothetical protein|nr:hypothetical protein [Solirubrobacterales bacterium]
MDPFIPLTLGAVILLVLVFMGLARAFESRGVDQLLDWQPTRDYETEIELEQDDVQQMIEAQNEYRRKRGAKEITVSDVEKQAAEDEQIRARGSGPFGRGGDDEEE